MPVFATTSFHLLVHSCHLDDVLAFEAAHLGGAE
jgi:hypothetical protein